MYSSRPVMNGINGGVNNSLGRSKNNPTGSNSYRRKDPYKIDWSCDMQYVQFIYFRKKRKKFFFSFIITDNDQLFSIAVCRPTLEETIMGVIWDPERMDSLMKRMKVKIH